MEAIDQCWRKSSYSGNGGSNCVEVARNLPHGISVRDSKDPHGPRLVFTAADWQEFTDRVKAGEHQAGLPPRYA